MSDLIKRDDVIEALKKNCRPNSCVNYANRWCEAACPKNEIEDFINSIPAYEPEKVLFANVTFDEDKLKEIVQTDVIDKIKSGELLLKAEEPQGDIFPMEIVAGKCPIEANGNCPLKPQGEWTIGYSAKQKKVAVCNLCNCVSFQGKTNFCHNCGAKMQKGGAE